MSNLQLTMWSRYRRAFSRYLGMLGLVLLSGCGGGTEPDVPADIALNPISLSFTAIGQSQQLSPTVTDQQGNPISDAALSWASSDPGVASVTSTGVVTAVGLGSAQVTARAGSVTAEAEVIVVQAPAALEKISGDGQNALAGQPVSTPPAVRVTDTNHNPIPGVLVTFDVISGRGRIPSSSITTDNSGIAQVGSWSLGSKGINELRATAEGTGIAGNPVTFTATGTSSFNILLRFLSSPTATQRLAFADAQTTWESLITGDLQDTPLSAAADQCGPGSPAVNETVDDLLILVTVGHIDGSGGVLGSAGPCFIRNSDNLSVLGSMIFDSEDLADIEAEGLLKVLIVHEMGHVLGFGSLWPTQGLLAEASLPPAHGTDPHFTGPQALAAFNGVGGAGYAGSKVPVEDSGGEGTADGHWRESVFVNELMTGFVDPGQNPLSTVTIASFADQGYTVNLLGADPFSLALSLRASGGLSRRELGSDILRLPVRKVDRAGRVVGWFRP